MGSVQIDIIENTSTYFIEQMRNLMKNRLYKETSNMKANLTRLLINLGSTTAAKTLTVSYRQKKMFERV